ncbi:MAG: hypothetical protein WC551_00670 [Patescibacteria group bacterium]
MPDHEFFKKVLPQGELSDDVWRELIGQREFTMVHLMDRYTPSTLGRFRLGLGDDGQCLWNMAKAQNVTIQDSDGCSMSSQGVFRLLKTPAIIRLGDCFRLWDRLQQPYYLLGFTRSGKWLVAEAKLWFSSYSYELQDLKVQETAVDQVVQEFAIDRRTIWEFLGNSILDIYKRKAEEFESLRSQADQVKEEQEFVMALYGCTTYPY